jgi:hypothetical protein
MLMRRPLLTISMEADFGSKLCWVCCAHLYQAVSLKMVCCCRRKEEDERDTGSSGAAAKHRHRREAEGQHASEAARRSSREHAHLDGQDVKGAEAGRAFQEARTGLGGSGSERKREAHRHSGSAERRNRRPDYGPGHTEQARERGSLDRRAERNHGEESGDRLRGRSDCDLEAELNAEVDRFLSDMFL